MKKIFSILVIIFSLFSLNSCVKHIEDKNGVEDYSLQVITDQQIIRGMNTVTMSSCSSHINNKGKLQIKKLSGVELITRFSSKEEIVKIKVTSKVNSGNLKIVVTNGSSIVKIIPINETYECEIFNTKETFFLKVAGESANFELNYEISGKVYVEDLD